MLINPVALPTFALAATLFWVSLMLARRTAKLGTQRILFAIGTLLALPCLVSDFFYTHLLDRWTWLYEFRAMPYSELTLAGVAFLAGILYHWMEPETFGERLVIPAALLVVVGVPFSKPVLAPIDQSSLQTACRCGPSSVATILKQYGQAASERELAQEALTYKGGTEAWYLARALRRRGFETDFVIQKTAPQTIPTPSIAGVVLPGDTGHFVAVLSSDADHVVIGDPLTGRLEVSRTEPNRRYRFTGFFLRVRTKRNSG